MSTFENMGLFQVLANRVTYTITTKTTANPTNDIVSCGKSNLDSNSVEDIDLPMIFVLITSIL